MAVVPEEINKKVKESGLGYMSNWLPQQAILRHKVRAPVNVSRGRSSIALFRHVVGSYRTEAKTPLSSL